MIAEPAAVLHLLALLCGVAGEAAARLGRVLLALAVLAGAARLAGVALVDVDQLVPAVVAVTVAAVGFAAAGLFLESGTAGTGPVTA